MAQRARSSRTGSRAVRGRSRARTRSDARAIAGDISIRNIPARRARGWARWVLARRRDRSITPWIRARLEAQWRARAPRIGRASRSSRVATRTDDVCVSHETGYQGCAGAAFGWLQGLHRGGFRPEDVRVRPRCTVSWVWILSAIRARRID